MAEDRDRNQAVVDHIRERLQSAPNGEVDVATLLHEAQEMDPEFGSLSLRQFNGRYYAPAKRALNRERAAEEGGTQTRTRSKAAKRQRGRARTHARAEAEERPVRRRRTAAEMQEEQAQRGRGVRNVLMEFARDLGSAEDRSGVISVLSDIDRYTDEILRAATGGER